MGYRVEQGKYTFTNGGTTGDHTLDTDITDLSRAFVLLHYFYGHIGTNAAVPNDDGMTSAYLWNDSGTTKIRFTRVGTAYTTYLTWTVIECTNQEFTVYRGSQAWDSTTDQYTPGIGGTVSGDNCFAWVNGTTSSQTDRERCREAHWVASVSTGSQTTLILDRYSPENGPNGTLRWIVVEFDVGGNFPGAIDTGEVTVTTQQEGSPQTFSITGCTKTQSIILAQWKVSGDDGLNAHAVAVRMDSNTQGSAYVHLTSNYTRVIRWYCIDFGTGSTRQDGQVDYSSTASWTTADQTITEVDTSRAISFVTLTCDGDGTAFPRPMCRHWLSASTTLEIERDYYGQESYIEWQVLELPSSDSDYTSFITPTGNYLNWVWNSGQYNIDSGMRATDASGTQWVWAVVSSSSNYYYPSGDYEKWAWVTGDT